jgi:hypothetical protein
MTVGKYKELVGEQSALPGPIVEPGPRVELPGHRVELSGPRVLKPELRRSPDGDLVIPDFTPASSPKAHGTHHKRRKHSVVKSGFGCCNNALLFLGIAVAWTTSLVLQRIFLCRS